MDLVIKYTGLFSPHLFFSLPHLQTVRPRLELAQTQSCSKRHNFRHWNLPSLKFALWHRGRHLTTHRSFTLLFLTLPGRFWICYELLKIGFNCVITYIPRHDFPVLISCLKVFINPDPKGLGSTIITVCFASITLSLVSLRLSAVLNDSGWVYSHLKFLLLFI